MTLRLVFAALATCLAGCATTDTTPALTSKFALGASTSIGAFR